MLNVNDSATRASSGSVVASGEHRSERFDVQFSKKRASSSTKRACKAGIGEPRRRCQLEPGVERIDRSTCRAAAASRLPAIAGPRAGPRTPAEFLVAAVEEVRDRREHEVVLASGSGAPARRATRPPAATTSVVSSGPSRGPRGIRPSRRGAARGSRRCAPRWSSGSGRWHRASRAASPRRYKQSSLFVLRRRGSSDDSLLTGV